ncbi:MAG: L-tyrosine/L-tryptophan isonitrile synthase family protein [Alphaproteobacteria bacterium]|nr:L-tyrosine/L-tryptophan isonitrile synthase family protein [Alphaproteobacteria bacterium]MCB9797274.1 L-tyrosine/L-tryptophan isonitrile synthase family protein [Alphaproteobacteria bacterium]
MSEALPTREAIERAQAVSREVVARFDALLRLPAEEGDLWEPKGRRRMSRALYPHALAGRPLPFLLPGFAFKNPNRAKTLGPLPDLAEQRALERLSRFCAAAREVYAPGAALTIFSGGWVWATPLGVSVQEVQQYWSVIQEMARGLEGLRFAALDTLWGVSPEEAMQRGLQWSDPARMGELREALTARRAGDLRRVLQRFIRLAQEDLGERLQDMDPELAVMRAMLQHRGFTEELDRHYPDHVRLSVHLSGNAGPKYSVRLVEQGPPGRVPYHCALLVDGEAERAVHRHEVPEARVVARAGRPWCLEAPAQGA